MATELAKRDARIASARGHTAEARRHVDRSGQSAMPRLTRSSAIQGGLWLSRAPTEAKPGGGSPAWRLAVKSGDAK